MFLAPLNYDRFFRKVFSDSTIAKKFLEDFFDIQIESIELLEEKHKLTDNAQTVEFDFRCQIDGKYVIIDMQQWYKADVVKRFYLYHTINTALQLETLPIKSILIEDFTIERTGDYEEIKPIVKNIRDYSGLLPVISLIWMVSDTLHFRNEDFIAYTMAPEIALDFIRKEEFWQNSEVREMQRKRVLEVLANSSKNLDFLYQNRLIYAFQHNIVKTKKVENYFRWFEFAEKTRNKENTEAEFAKYEGDEIFMEMMRRLRKDFLSQEDSAYIKHYEEMIARVKRWEDGVRREAKEDAMEEIKEEAFGLGMEEGMEKGMEKGIYETAKNGIIAGFSNEIILKMTKLSDEQIEKLRNELINSNN